MSNEKKKVIAASKKAEAAFAQQPELAQHAAVALAMSESNLRSAEMIGFSAAEYANQGLIGPAALARDIVATHALIAGQYAALARALAPDKAAILGPSGAVVN